MPTGGFFEGDSPASAGVDSRTVGASISGRAPSPSKPDAPCGGMTGRSLVYCVIVGYMLGRIGGMDGCDAGCSGRCCRVLCFVITTRDCGIAGIVALASGTGDML